MEPQHLATLLRLCGLKWAVYDKLTSEPIAYCLSQIEADTVRLALNKTTKEQNYPDSYATKELKE